MKLCCKNRLNNWTQLKSWKWVKWEYQPFQSQKAPWQSWNEDMSYMINWKRSFFPHLKLNFSSSTKRMNGAGVGLDEVIIGLNTPFDHSLRLYPRTFSRIFVKKLEFPSENVIGVMTTNDQKDWWRRLPRWFIHPQ